MAIDSEWEKFQGGPAESTHTRLHATISPKRKILINGNLYRAWGKPDGVYLLFNRGRDQIALQPTGARLPGAFPVKENRGCYQIMAGPFCRHFEIKIDATHKFIRPEINHEGKLILNLSETTLVTRTKRKPREAK